MATKKKLNTSCGCAVAPDMKPRLWIDLNEEDMDILSELSVGKMVAVAIKGKVVSVSQRSNEYEGEAKKVTGEFQLENHEVELMTMNDFEALVDD
jgi:hypothetical protein